MKRGAVVLCGGRSSRMGRDKASLPFGDETLLQRVVRLVRGRVSEVVVVAAADQVVPPLPADVVLARDELDAQGPLGGLAPGLRASRADAVFASACDAPFLEPAVIDLLFDALGEGDVAVAELDGFVHPLAAVYRTGVLPRIERLLAEGRLRPVYLYDEVDTVRVGEQRLRAVDPELRTFENLNTPAAYEAALAHFGRRPAVRIELFEMARRLAGVREIQVAAGTLREALAALAASHPALDPDVIRGDALAPHWRAGLNGRRWIDDPDQPLAEGDVLLLISALAGG